MSAPELPTWQDCHELWSKKRRRQLREQQESLQNLPPGKPGAVRDNKVYVKTEDSADVGGSSKGLKMDAATFPHSANSYDPSGFPFNLGSTIKPGLLGAPPNIPSFSQSGFEMETLTPPSKQRNALSNSSNPSEQTDGYQKTSLHRHLEIVEQLLIKNVPIPLTQLLALEADAKVEEKPAQLIDILRSELRQASKFNPNAAHTFHLNKHGKSIDGFDARNVYDGDNAVSGKQSTGSLTTSGVCAALSALFNYYGLNNAIVLLHSFIMQT